MSEKSEQTLRNASNFVRTYLEGSADAKRRAAESNELQRGVAATAVAIAEAMKADRKLLICGNGGSAADAQHTAAELIVRLSGDRPRRALPAIALTTDTSILTACANDLGYEEIFARQVEALGQRGDVLLGISTSGNSKNVIRAFEVAREREMICCLFTGGTGGELRSMAHHLVLAPAPGTSRIQEIHEACFHAMCYLVEDLVFGKATGT